jgi:hypothetical protein
MTYDWEGTRTRRVRKLKLCLAATVSALVIAFTAVQTNIGQLALF